MRRTLAAVTIVMTITLVAASVAEAAGPAPDCTGLSGQACVRGMRAAGYDVTHIEVIQKACAEDPHCFGYSEHLGLGEVPGTGGAPAQCPRPGEIGNCGGLNGAIVEYVGSDAFVAGCEVVGERYCAFTSPSGSEWWDATIAAYEPEGGGGGGEVFGASVAEPLVEYVDIVGAVLLGVLVAAFGGMAIVALGKAAFREARRLIGRLV